MTDRRQRKNKWFRKLRHGFTMAEVLTVVAIIGILAAFGTVNVYRHQKNLHLTELDDTAREIFTAAQDHLTIANASGRWQKFSKDADNLGQPMENKPSDSGDIRDWNNSKKHNFHYFEVGNSNTKKLQDIILPANSIDGTIVPTDTQSDHQIIIEYDAQTATVYGVWYTDGKSGWFGQAKTDRLLDNGEERDPVFANGREDKAVRRDHKPQQVGYYGGSMRNKAKDYKDELSAPDAKIVNTDKLYIQMPYTYGKENENIVTSVKVKGDISGSESEREVWNSRNSFYIDQSGHESETPVSAVYKCFLLDSVTDGRRGHFANKYKNLIPGEDITVTVTNTKGNRSRSKELHTNSLFSDIEMTEKTPVNTSTAKYTAYIKYGRHLQNLSTVVSNVGLAITNATIQHDLNWDKFYLRKYKEQDQLPQTERTDHISTCTLDDTGSSALYSIVNQSLLSLEGNYDENKDDGQDNHKNHKIENLSVQPELEENSVGLIGNAGNETHSFTIEDLTITNPQVKNLNKASGTQNVGLFVGEVKNKVNLLDCAVEVSEDDTITSNDNLSLFVGKSQAGSRLMIRKSEVMVDPGGSLRMTSGSDDVGLLIGQACGNVTIDDSAFTLNEPVSLMAEDGNSGGLIGNDKGKTAIEDIRITSTDQLSIESKGSSNSKGKGNVAILIGRSANHDGLTIRDTQLNLKGSTNLVAMYRNAGGLIGNTSVKTDIENVNISANRVSFASGTDNEKLMIGHVGGLIGKVDGNKTLKLSRTDITFTSKDFKNNETQIRLSTADGNVGGLIGDASGEASGNVQINDCHMQAETNVAISGSGNGNSYGDAGGLIGASSVKTDITDSDITASNNFSVQSGVQKDPSDSLGAGGIVGRFEGNCAFTLSEVNIQGKSSSDSIRISASYGNAGGLIGDVSDGKSGQLKIGQCQIETEKDMTVSGNGAKKGYGNAGGLIGDISSVFSANVQISDCDIQNNKALNIYGGSEKENGYGNAGGVIGRLEPGQVTNVAAVLDKVSMSLNGPATIQSAKQNAGGMIGTSSMQTTVQNDSEVQVSDSLTVESVADGSSERLGAGGIVGRFEGSQSVLLSGVNLTGNDTADTISIGASYGNAGGLIGDASDSNSQKVEIDNCDILNHKNMTVSGKGSGNNYGNAGGLIGLSSVATNITGSNIKEIRQVGIASNVTSNQSGHLGAGGVIGRLKGNKPLTITQTQLNFQEEPANVSADYGNAGGFIGDISNGVSGTIQITGSNIEGNMTVSGSSGDQDDNGYGNAGGLIGYADDCLVNLTDDQVAVEDPSGSGIEITANTNAGGVVGCLKPITSMSNTIRNIRYNGGKEGVVRAGRRSAAGFVGRIESSGLSIADSYTSTYVYMEGKSTANVGRAGGFIGYLEQDTGTTTIDKCYYGGRTDYTNNPDTYGYGSVKQYNGKPSQDAYNIINRGGSVQGSTDTATAGGFLGTAQGDVAKSIIISSSFTTGSAYVRDGAAGGFVGKASTGKNEDNAPLLLTKTYVTGLVDSDNSNSAVGAFVGLFKLNQSSRENAYLDTNGIYRFSSLNGNQRIKIYAIGKVNSDDGKNQDKDQDVFDITSDDGGKHYVIKEYSSTDKPDQTDEYKPPENPFSSVDSATRPDTSSYDDFLKGGRYPYRFYTTSIPSYIGDWPFVSKDQENKHSKWQIEPDQGQISAGQRITVNYAGNEGYYTYDRTDPDPRISKVRQTITDRSFDIDQSIIDYGNSQGNAVKLRIRGVFASGKVERYTDEKTGSYSTSASGEPSSPKGGDEWPDVEHIPDNTERIVDAEIGDVYIYQGRKYVSASNRKWVFTKYWSNTPDKMNGDFYAINESTIWTDSNLVSMPGWNPDDKVLNNLKIGDLYRDSNGKYYVYRGGASFSNPQKGPQDWIPVKDEYAKNW